jgi:hypothetical protein
MPAKADKAYFTPADVFNVTGVSAAKLNQWIDRGTVIPSRLDKKPNGSGDWRRISLETVHQIAIAEAGVRFRIPARLAAEGARLLAVGQPGRAANELFEFGLTAMVHTEDGIAIRNLDSDASLSEVFGRPFQNATIIDIGPIIKAVDESISKLKDNK